MRLMRKAVGPDFDLMVDAHTWWRMGDRSYSLATVEQLARGHGRATTSPGSKSPCRPTTTPPTCALKEKDLVPLATGEHEPNEERYLDLILTQAVDYVQMDVCCQGGYSLGRRLFAEIARQGLRFAFHSWGTALEVIAAAHLGICWPETGGGVAGVSLLLDARPRRHVPVPAGRRDPHRAAAKSSAAI